MITLSDKSLPSKSLALSATIAWPTTDPLPTPWPLSHHLLSGFSSY